MDIYHHNYLMPTLLDLKHPRDKPSSSEFLSVT